MREVLQKKPDSWQSLTPPPVIAVSLTGIRAGVPLIVAYTLISMWTVHLLNALYLEYKRSKVSHSPFSLPAVSPRRSHASHCVIISWENLSR